MIVDISIKQCAAWALAIGLFLGLIGALTGCTPSGTTGTATPNAQGVVSQQQSDSHPVGVSWMQKLPDGMHIPCVGYGGGLTCDWNRRTP